MNSALSVNVFMNVCETILKVTIPLGSLAYLHLEGLMVEDDSVHLTHSMMMSVKQTSSLLWCLFPVMSSVLF